MHRFRNRNLAGVAGVAAALFLTTAAVRESAPGVSFRISSSTKIYPGDTPRAQDDEVMRGRGVAVNGRARIEFLAFTPAPAGLTTDDFVIAADSGHAFILHAGNQRVTPADDMFGGPAVVAFGRIMGGRGGFGGRGEGNADGAAGGGGGGRGAAGGGGRPGRGAGGPPGGGGAGGDRGGRGAAGRGRGRGGVGSGFLSQVELLDVTFKLEKLGAGDVVDGRPTQHVRVTTDYRILWGDQSVPAHAVTEMWTAKLPVDFPNPFEPLIVADQSTDGPLIEYSLKLRAIRAQLDGTPVKVITTTTLTNVREIAGFQSLIGNDPTLDKVTIVQATEIRGVQPAEVDPRLVATPENPGDSST